MRRHACRSFSDAVFCSVALDVSHAWTSLGCLSKRTLAVCLIRCDLRR